MRYVPSSMSQIFSTGGGGGEGSGKNGGGEGVTEGGGGEGVTEGGGGEGVTEGGGGEGEGVGVLPVCTSPYVFPEKRDDGTGVAFESAT